MSSDATTTHTGELEPPPTARSLVPRHRTLDGFVEAVSQADGIGLTDVDVFTTLVVQTDKSVYPITIIQPHTRDVVVQAGRVVVGMSPLHCGRHRPVVPYHRHPHLGHVCSAVRCGMPFSARTCSRSSSRFQRCASARANRVCR